MLRAEAGAFEASLQLLRTFAAQLRAEAALGVHAGAAEVRRRAGYANILYNLSGYYGQFSAPLERAVAAERKPLEDKLQDFVKLAQWNDRTYVALRLSVEKS